MGPLERRIITGNNKSSPPARELVRRAAAALDKVTSREKDDCARAGKKIHVRFGENYEPILYSGEDRFQLVDGAARFRARHKVLKARLAARRAR